MGRSRAVTEWGSERRDSVRNSFGSSSVSGSSRDKELDASGMPRLGVANWIAARAPALEFGSTATSPVPGGCFFGAGPGRESLGPYEFLRFLPLAESPRANASSMAIDRPT